MTQYRAGNTEGRDGGNEKERCEKWRCFSLPVGVAYSAPLIPSTVHAEIVTNEKYTD